MERITSLNPFILAAGMVLIITGLSLFFFWIFVRLRTFKEENWSGTRFIASFFNIIGALLGLVLAMILVTIWQNYQEEQEHVTTEVATYANIYRDIKKLPDDVRVNAEVFHKQILKDIIYDSWPKMKKGHEGLKERESLERLIDFISNHQVDNVQDKLDKDSMLERLKMLTELRKSRSLKVANSMIPDMMWWVIAFCIFLSIFCGYLFPIRPVLVHGVLVCLHAAMVSIVVFLILSLMYPYRQPTYISSEPFENLLDVVIPTIDKSHYHKNSN